MVRISFIGVIVTDVMPKDKEDSKFWNVSSNVYVVKADAAIDILDVLRGGVISNFILEESFLCNLILNS